MTTPKKLAKSNKLANVCYDIRGPVLERARQMEDEGQRIIKLNIGNPASFGFEVPEEIMQDVIRNMGNAAVIPIAKVYLRRAKPLCITRKASILRV